MFDFEQKIVLENDNVRLEQLTLNNLNDLLPIGLEHPELVQFSPIAIGSRESMTEFINRTINTENWYGFTIYDKLSNEFAGSTSYLNISNQNKSLEIGATWIHPKFQRTGLNRNCKFLLLQYTFEHLNFNRATLKTDYRNEQSKTAIKKIGAKYEGTIRQDTIMLDGYLRDSVYFGILKHEWLDIKTTIFNSIS